MTGQADIAGTLNVSCVNRFRPAIGDRFAIVTSSSETGNFSTINSPGFTARSDASPSGIVLTVTALDPELRITSITRNGNDIAIVFTATGGRHYRLERNFLTAVTWEPIAGVADIAPSSSGLAQFTHLGGASLMKAFYRIRLLKD